MKLDRLLSGVFAAGLVAAAALACGGCSGSVSAPKTASADPNVSGTTSLMSAQIPGPAPKVGKSHLVVEDEVAPVANAEEGAPKEARRSDGSRRGGDFGSSSK